MNIPIINDNVYELEETFQLEISVPEAAVAAGVIDGCDPYTPSATVSIADDDRKLYITRRMLAASWDELEACQHTIVLFVPEIII